MRREKNEVKNEEIDDFDLNYGKVDSFETQFSKLGLSRNVGEQIDDSLVSRPLRNRLHNASRSSEQQSRMYATSEPRRKSEVSNRNQDIERHIFYPQSISSALPQSRHKHLTQNHVHWELVPPELQLPAPDIKESPSFESTFVGGQDSLRIRPSQKEVKSEATRSPAPIKHEDTRNNLGDRTKLTSYSYRYDDRRESDTGTLHYPALLNLKSAPPMNSIAGESSRLGNNNQYHVQATEGRRNLSSERFNTTHPGQRSADLDWSRQVLHELNELHKHDMPDTYDSDRNLVVYFIRGHRRIQGLKKEKEYMTWTISESNHPLKCLNIPNIEPAHVHFHFNRQIDDVHVWMLHDNYYWRDHTLNYAQPHSIPIRHPIHNDLYLTTYGNNSWLPNFVKFETLKKRTYPLPIVRAFSPPDTHNYE